MGDLSKLNSDREAFKAAVADTYPNKKPGAIPNNAGQLFRFVHEMEKGDLVVFPNKNDRKINVGRVEPPPIPSNAANLTPWTKSNFLAVTTRETLCNMTMRWLLSPL